MERNESTQKRGPSGALWRLHRDEIVDLYQEKPLGEVMCEMEQRYNFKAT